MAAQPSILAKSGKKGLENIVLLFLVFQGQFGQKVYFCYYEFGLISKYFLPKPLRRTNMTMQNLLLYFTEFVSLAGKPGWNLATVVYNPKDITEVSAHRRRHEVSEGSTSAPAEPEQRWSQIWPGIPEILTVHVRCVWFKTGKMKWKKNLKYCSILYFLTFLLLVTL